MYLDFTPPRAPSATGHAGTWRRTLPVALDRMYENALDWEHLPWVHPAGFAAISCLEASAEGWRARVTAPDGGVSVVELTLDRSCRRWVTRVLEGAGAGNEIWTVVTPVAPRQLEIVVDFFLPEVPVAARPAAGAAYARFYARLYDEDVAMMVERADQLDRRLGRDTSAVRAIDLGPRAALALPLTVELGGQPFVIAEDDGELLAFPARCPHQLGPLAQGPICAGVVTCPWHGDRFDLRTGRNLGGRPCHLQPLPRIEADAAGAIRVSLPAAAVEPREDSAGADG